jgi:hypothetical protein
MMDKTCNKIAKIENILLRQNILKFDCDLYIHYNNFSLNVLWMYT